MSGNPAREASPPAGVRYSGPLGWLGIWKGEAAFAVLGWLYLFLIVASYLVVKSVRNGLFIAEYGAVKLPYVMLGIAVLVGVFASFYIRLARRFSTVKLVVWTLVFFCSNLLLFWWLAIQGQKWLYPILYIWAGGFGVIATAQVWTVLNEIFTTREAKRLFGFIGSGGILGGAAGGGIAFRLTQVIGSRNLLLVVVVLLLLAAATVVLLGRHRSARRSCADEHPHPENLSESLKIILRRPHLRLLGMLVFLTALATTTADFQFSYVVDQNVSGEDALSSYFGAVFGTISLISFAMQLLVTNRILKHLGIGIAILILPLSLVLGSAALITTSALWAAVFIKGSDGAFKHSLDRTGRELLYLPLPQSLKVQAKSTIDTVMDRLGDGMAGVMLLILTAALGLGLQATLIANLVAIGAWIVVAVLLRRNYMESLKAAMGRVGLRRAPGVASIDDADTREILETVLRDGTPDQQLGAIEWMAREPALLREDLLVPLVRDTTPRAVRSAALSALLGGFSGNMPQELVASLEGEGQSVLVSAIELLTTADPSTRRQQLESLLSGARATDRLPVVAFMVRNLGKSFDAFATQLFDAMIEDGSPSETRQAAARALGLFPPGAGPLAHLPKLLEDRDPAVAAAAAESAGTLQRVDLLPALIGMLERRGGRLAGRRALRACGLLAAAPMAQALADDARSVEIRRELPPLLAAVGDSAAAEALARAVDDKDSEIRNRSLEALVRLRWRRPDFEPLEREDLSRAADRLCDRLQELGTAQQALSQLNEEPAAAAGAYLLEGLRQEHVATTDRALKLLALAFPVTDMDRVRRAILGRSLEPRANALEYLDNVLPRKIKRRLLPLLELDGVRDARPEPLEDVLRRLAEGPEPWLAASALHLARNLSLAGLEPQARQAADSTYPSLREEARLWLDQGTEAAS